MKLLLVIFSIIFLFSCKPNGYEENKKMIITEQIGNKISIDKYYEASLYKQGSGYMEYFIPCSYRDDDLTILWDHQKGYLITIDTNKIMIKIFTWTKIDRQ